MARTGVAAQKRQPAAEQAASKRKTILEFMTSLFDAEWRRHVLRNHAQETPRRSGYQMGAAALTRGTARCMDGVGAGWRTQGCPMRQKPIEHRSENTPPALRLREEEASEAERSSPVDEGRCPAEKAGVLQAGELPRRSPRYRSSREPWQACTRAFPWRRASLVACRWQSFCTSDRDARHRKCLELR